MRPFYRLVLTLKSSHTQVIQYATRERAFVELGLQVLRTRRHGVSRVELFDPAGDLLYTEENP